MDMISYFFFFNDTATTEIYTLSLHDALPIFKVIFIAVQHLDGAIYRFFDLVGVDRKSTRLNSSHSQISYAVSCLKKKTEENTSCLTAPSPPMPFQASDPSHPAPVGVVCYSAA